MIRYSITRAQLEQELEAEQPGWLRRARARTKKFLAAGKYKEKESIWSEVKAVYMRLQHNKCAYCERQLTSPDYGGAIEHDLEHYRPKNEVPAWPPVSTDEDGPVSISFPTGAELPAGYYATSCKKCNSPLKRNFFPIAGARATVGTDALGLAAEQPYLVYPLGDGDEDPEELLTFSGITAIPRKKNGPRWRRARVMIEFFKLNSREELLRERANQLIRLANALTVLEHSSAPTERKELAERDIAHLQQPSSPHASCVRAACELYQQDPRSAWKLFHAADDYLGSLS